MYIFNDSSDQKTIPIADRHQLQDISGQYYTKKWATTRVAHAFEKKEAESALRGFQRLLDVRNDVIHTFDSDRKADKIGCYTGSDLFFRTQLLMGG